MRNFLTALLLCGIQNWVCLNWRARQSVHFFTAAFPSGALGNLSTYKSMFSNNLQVPTIQGPPLFTPAFSATITQ